MEKFKFKELCGSINYNTYNSIENLLGITGIGLSSIGIILAKGCIPQYSMLTIPTCALGGLSFLTYLRILDLNGSCYTKDLQQIKELYHEFLKNYNELNKIFGLNDPIQIQTMFRYLLCRGYLSKDKKFEFSEKQARDIEGIYGANVITGSAVCRHISPMLTDILNESGIESSNLTVHCKDYIIDFPKLQIENIFTRGKANHMVTFAFKDGNGYFLDPTQGRIYRIDESNQKVIHDDISEMRIRLADSQKYNSLESYLSMKERLASKYSSPTNGEARLVVNETREICWDNMDIFEQFYQKNRELYNDIASRVLKIKKTKR